MMIDRDRILKLSVIQGFKYKKKRVLITGFFLCLSLFGCVTSPPLSLQTSLPNKALIKGLAFYPQESDQCGPESLATLLSSVGVDKKPEDLSPYMFLPAKGGTLTIDLIAQARQQGVLVYKLSPSLDDLLAEIAVGNPVLILQNLGFSWRPKWHFAVVIGFNLRRQEMILRSGPKPEYVIPISLLERTWTRGNNWAITIVKPGEFPATVDLNRYLQAAIDLETTGQKEAAYKAYFSLSQQWPENITALFGLGNTAYAREHYQQAKQAFENIVDMEPLQSNAWNNLAYALARLECSASAKYSAQCAVKIAPNNPQYLNTYDKFQANQSHSDTDQCLKISCPY
jgi:hypothetical protein